MQQQECQDRLLLGRAQIHRLGAAEGADRAEDLEPQVVGHVDIPIKQQ
ncbi:hypothetical protein AB0M02_02330 [Actinoplanes sp. NPDC051861]